MRKKNLFLENKGKKKNHKLVYASMNLRMQPRSLRTQVGFQKHKKGKFFTLMLRFETNPTLSRSRSKPPFLQYK